MRFASWQLPALIRRAVRPVVKVKSSFWRTAFPSRVWNLLLICCYLLLLVFRAGCIRPQSGSDVPSGPHLPVLTTAAEGRKPQHIHLRFFGLRWTFAPRGLSYFSAVITHPAFTRSPQRGLDPASTAPFLTPPLWGLWPWPVFSDLS